MQYFLDELAAPRFRKTRKKSHPKGFGSGCFLEAFGNGFPVVGDMLARTTEPFHRFQGIWRDNHRFGKKEFDLAISFGKKLNEMVSHYGKPVYYSPWCEHGESGNAIKQLLDTLKPFTPNLKLVNCPNKGGPILSGYDNETHGDWTPNGITLYSADGQSSVDTDIEARKRTCKKLGVKYFGFWDANFNLKKEDKDSTPRPERKVRPQPHIFKALAYLANDKGDTHLPSHWIYKTHAEQHNNPESPREHKPVLICPVSGDYADLIACNGKRVARLERRGNYTDGRPVYRIENKVGFQLAEKAKKLAGCDLVSIKINKKEYGAINPAFREGSYIYD